MEISSRIERLVAFLVLVVSSSALSSEVLPVIRCESLAGGSEGPSLVVEINEVYNAAAVRSNLEASLSEINSSQLRIVGVYAVRTSTGASGCEFRGKGFSLVIDDDEPSGDGWYPARLDADAGGRAFAGEMICQVLR